MSLRKRSTLTAALVAVASLTITACGSSGDGAAPSSSGSAGGELTLYNAQHDTLAKEWVEKFTAETGIKVTIRQGKDSELAQQIIAEGERSPADVFLTENSPAMTQVENKGLFADVDPATLAQVNNGLKPSTGKWTGIAARSTVLVYDKRKVTPEQLPKSMADLATPEWKGRWSASPSGADFQAIVSAYLQLKGEQATKDWLKAMKENATEYKGNGAAMKAVNAGEVDTALIYHYYFYGDQAKTGENSGNVGTHYFKNQDPGAFVSISGGGVLKSSKKQAQAQQLLKFITSKAGQEVLEKGTSFEYPVASGVPANAKLVPMADLQAPTVDPATLNGPQVVTLMTEAGLL